MSARLTFECYCHMSGKFYTECMSERIHGSFMSCLHSLLGYSTGEFQALQLIVLAAFGAVD